MHQKDGPQEAPQPPRLSDLEAAARERLSKILWKALHAAEKQINEELKPLGVLVYDYGTEGGAIGARALIFDAIGARPGKWEHDGYFTTMPKLDDYARQLARSLADQLVKDFRSNVPTPTEGPTGRSSPSAA